MTKHRKNTFSIKSIVFLIAFFYFFYGYCITELRIQVTQDKFLQVSGINRDELIKIGGINALTSHYSIDCTILSNNQENDIKLRGIDAEILPLLGKELSCGNYYPINSDMPYLLCTEDFIEKQFGKDKLPQTCLNKDILLTYQDYSLMGKICGVLKNSNTVSTEKTDFYISPAWARKLLEKGGQRPAESYLMIMKDAKAKDVATLSIQAAGGSVSPDNAEKTNQIKSLRQDNHWRMISMILCFFGFFP